MFDCGKPIVQILQTIYCYKSMNNNIKQLKLILKLIGNVEILQGIGIFNKTKDLNGLQCMAHIVH